MLLLNSLIIPIYSQSPTAGARGIKLWEESHHTAKRAGRAFLSWQSERSASPVVGFSRQFSDSDCSILDERPQKPPKAPTPCLSPARLTSEWERSRRMPLAFPYGPGLQIEGQFPLSAPSAPRDPCGRKHGAFFLR